MLVVERELSRLETNPPCIFHADGIKSILFEVTWNGIGIFKIISSFLSLCKEFLWMPFADYFKGHGLSDQFTPTELAVMHILFTLHTNVIDRIKICYIIYGNLIAYY